MKKFLILPAFALLIGGGIFALGQQSKPAYAAGPTVVQTGQQGVNKESIVSSEKPDATETGTEVKGAETDGPGGHQDPQGANVDHQVDGAE